MAFAWIQRVVSSLSLREKKLVFMIILLFILVVLGGGLWLLYDKTAASIERQRLIREALSELGKKQRSYTDATGLLRELERRTPESTTSLASLIEAVAKKNDISIQVQRPLPDTQVGKKYVLHSAEIVLPALPWPPLLHFLEQLESTTDRIVRVTEITMRGQGAPQKTLGVTLTVSVYDRATTPKSTDETSTAPKATEKTKEAP